MSLFSKLFGGGGSSSTPEPEAIDYNGYAVTPSPIREGNRYRVSARIEKEIGGETKTHTLIRADTIDDLETAVEASLGKAKMLIDQQGDRLFD
jgi:hypothetical protein